MSSVTRQRQSNRPAYIRRDPDSDGRSGDIARELHRRRKSAMVSLLSEFEAEIAPLIAEGHDEVIDHFKRSCREKLNALTFEALELAKLAPGESLNEHAVDLAAQLSFGQTEDPDT